jgi:hypothetical protein
MKETYTHSGKTLQLPSIVPTLNIVCALTNLCQYAPTPDSDQNLRVGDWVLTERHLSNLMIYQSRIDLFEDKDAIKPGHDAIHILLYSMLADSID